MTRTLSSARSLGTIDIVVPGDPVGKGRGKVGRVGDHVRVFTPSKTRRYEERLKDYAAAAMQGEPLLLGPLEVDLIAWFTMPKTRHRKREPRGMEWKTTKPDLDNLVKCLDALNGIVWQDDAQVVRITAEKWVAPQGKAGSLRVRVRAATGPEWEDPEFDQPF